MERSSYIWNFDPLGWKRVSSDDQIFGLSHAPYFVYCDQLKIDWVFKHLPLVDTGHITYVNMTF